MGGPKEGLTWKGWLVVLLIAYVVGSYIWEQAHKPHPVTYGPTCEDVSRFC